MEEAQWHLFCTPLEARQDKSGSQQFPAWRQNRSTREAAHLGSRSVASPSGRCYERRSGDAGAGFCGEVAYDGGNVPSHVPLLLDIFLK